MNKLVAVLKLTRIEHSLMLIIAVIAGELLAGGLPQLQLLILSLIPPVFISMGSFAINDYFDIEVDRQNKKDRPLVNGSLKPAHVAFIALFSFVFGVAVSAFINAYAFAIALVFAILAFAYSYRLKEILLLGNAYIALAMVIPYIYGNYVVSSALVMSMLPISAMIFMAGLAREIDGTIRDYSGDVRKRGVRSIPKSLGIRNAAIAALVLYVLASSVSGYLFAYVAPFSGNLIFALMILASDLLLLYTGLGYISRRSTRFYDSARNLSLAALSLAIVAILLAPLISVHI